jgi:hypothetical protein
MAQLAPSPKFRAVGADGLALVGGKLWTYTEGTSTPKATYTSFTLGASNTNPVILDARGEADVWLDGSYKLVLTDAADVTIWTVDSIRDLTQNQTFTGATLAGTLTVSSTAVTWSGNPTHSGNHTFSGNVTVSGNLTAANLKPVVAAVKSATTSRSSTTTLSNDPHLTVALTSGTWTIDCYLPIWATTSGAGGLKLYFAYSGTTTSSSWAGDGIINAGSGVIVPKTVNADTFIASAINTQAGLPGADWERLTGFLTVTTSGTFSLQWAQNSSNANAANIGQGAWLVCTKVS